MAKAKQVDKKAEREKKRLQEEAAREKKQSLKEKKKQQQLKAKLKKAEQKQKAKDLKFKEKLQRKDPVWKAKQREKKHQEKLNALKKKQQDKHKKLLAKRTQKMQKQKEKQLRKNPAWLQQQQEKKTLAQLKAKQGKILMKEKKRLSKEKSKQKKLQLQQKKREQQAAERELRKDPEWVQAQKEKKLQDKEAASQKKQSVKEKEAAKKVQLKEKKTQASLKKKGITVVPEDLALSVTLSKKKIVIISLIATILLGMGGGVLAFVWLHPAPEKVTDLYLKAFQQQKTETMKRYSVDHYLFISQKIMTEPAYQDVKAIMEEKVYGLEYTLGEVQMSDTSATVVVNFKAYNLGEAMQKAIREYRVENTLKKISGKVTDQELEAELAKKLVQVLGAEEKKYEEAVTVNLIKVNGKWLIDSLSQSNVQLTKLLTGCVFVPPEPTTESK